MSDESAGGQHAAPTAAAPPPSLSAPEASKTKISKREKRPFGGREEKL